MAQCMDEISLWMKLNLSKTEVMLVYRGKHFKVFGATVKSPLAEDTQLVNSVHSPRVLLDSLLMLSSQTAASMSNTFYHLHLSRKLCSILSDE